MIAVDGSSHPSSLPTHRFDSDVVPEMLLVFMVTQEEWEVSVFWWRWREFLSGSTLHFKAPLLPLEVIDVGGSPPRPPLSPHGFNSHTVPELPTAFGGAEGEAGPL